MARGGRSGQRLLRVALVVAALNLAAFAGLTGLAAAGMAFWGVGILAYLLGARHAFDIDHIAVIDNVTRRLRQDVHRPVAVGLFFSLGHSTVVIAATAALLLGGEHIRHLLPLLRGWGGVLGAGVSAAFLIIIGTANVAIARQVWKLRGECGEGAGAREIETLLERRGFMARLTRFAYRRIDRSRKMYWVGLLFGLGFDTASEIILLALTAAAMHQYGMNPWLLLVLPLLFAAGMTLMDSACGLGILTLYDWSITGGRRRWMVNMGLTGVSTLLAFGVGAMELSASIHWSVVSASGIVAGAGAIFALLAFRHSPGHRPMETAEIGD